jgi:hypothetical protein
MVKENMSPSKHRSIPTMSINSKAIPRSHRMKIKRGIKPLPKEEEDDTMEETNSFWVEYANLFLDSTPDEISIINKLENNINRMLEIKIKLIKESNYDHDTFDTEFEKSIDDFFGFIRYTNKLCNHDSETISTKAKELLKLLNPKSIFSVMKRIIIFKGRFDDYEDGMELKPWVVPLRIRRMGLLYCTAIENNNLFSETNDARLVDIYQIYRQYLKYSSKATSELGRILELGDYKYHPAMYLWKNSTDENDGMILFRNIALFHTDSKLLINFDDQDVGQLRELQKMFEPWLSYDDEGDITYFVTNLYPGFENDWSSDTDTLRKWNLPARLRTKKFLRVDSKPILAMHFCKQYDIIRHGFISQSEIYGSWEQYGSETDIRTVKSPIPQKSLIQSLKNERSKQLTVVLQDDMPEKAKRPERIRLEKIALKFFGDLSSNHPLNDKEPIPSIPSIRLLEKQIYSIGSEHTDVGKKYMKHNDYCSFLDLSLLNLLRKESDKKRFVGFSMFDNKKADKLLGEATQISSEMARLIAEEILAQHYKTIPLYEKGKRTWSRTNKITRMNLYTRIIFQSRREPQIEPRLAKPSNSPLERVMHPIRLESFGKDVAPNALIINIVLDRFHTLIMNIVNNESVPLFLATQKVRNVVSLFIGIELCILHFIAHHASPNLVDSNFVNKRTINSLKTHLSGQAPWIADYPTKRNTGTEGENEEALIFDSKSDIFVRKSSFAEGKDADPKRIYVESEIDDDRSPQHLFSILQQFCFIDSRWTKSDSPIEFFERETIFNPTSYVFRINAFLEQKEPKWDAMCKLIEQFKQYYPKGSLSYFE